ncbi:MAG: hypothetical protein DYG92_02910 [Leptolyngbya sp. PLA1]|nr:hypothetical protein [Leptolyngbya sp. PLA1]
MAARSLRQPDEYFDHGSIERTAWSMTPGALAVSPHGISQRQFEYTRMGRSRREQLCTLLSGGLSVAGEMRIPLVISPRSDGGCMVSGQVTYGPVTHRLEAGCSWQSGGPTVEYVSLESTGGDSPGTRRWTSTGWQASELGPWCAGEVVEHDPHGTPVLRTRLIALQPCAPEDVERRAAVPPLRGDDPVRGTVTFVGITDFRDRGSYTTMDDAGNQVVRALNEHPGAIESRRLRYAGWLLAASIAAGLVALRVRSILANRRRAEHSANTGEGSRP